MRLRFRIRDLCILMAFIAIPLALLASEFASISRRYDYSHRYPDPKTNPGDAATDITGDYYLGDGLGYNLSLSILGDGRYSLFWSGCRGIYDRESGWVRQANERREFSPLGPAIGNRLDRAFLPIRWGSRLYLVPPQKMANFCDAIVSGEEPRADGERGRFYLKTPAPTAAGLPALPAEWTAYLIGEMMSEGETAVSATPTIPVPRQGNAP